MNLEDLRNKVTEGVFRIEGHKVLLQRLQTGGQDVLAAEAEAQLASLVADQARLVAQLSALRAQKSA